MIENRSVVRLVFGVDYATFGADRVFLQLAPLAFDASTFEIWGALLHGGRLVPAADGPPDLDELSRLIRDQGVTTAWLTASLFNEIVESRPATLAGVREILTGGEALSPRHVRMAYEALPHRWRIINGYGPTESTTFACCHTIDPDGLEGVENIPIGRPIGNTRAYVFDGARAAGSAGSGGRALPGRRRPGAGLPQPARGDCRAISWSTSKSASGCTEPAIGCAGAAMARSSSWAGSTTRSNYEGSASSPARSRPPCAAIPRSTRRRYSSAKIARRSPAGRVSGHRPRAANSTRIGTCDAYLRADLARAT